MTEFQEKLLQTFKIFAQFCKDNHLTYYAAFGTCLGAIRHNGFIPWDDDIDVYMLRDDYERMLLLRDKLVDSVYWISDFRDGESPYPFAKFYSTDCSVWELRQFPFIIGPWVDIFPLDEWNSSEEVSELYDDYQYSLWKYRKALSTQSFREICFDIIHRNGYNGLIKMVKKSMYSPFRQFLFDKALLQTKRVLQVYGDFYKDWNQVKNKVFNKEWFCEVIEVPFEDTMILCPSHFDEILTYEYGEYMVLPPLEQRVGKHNFFYCNLEEKKSANEIINELRRKGDLTMTEAKPLSFKVLLDEIVHRKGF